MPNPCRGYLDEHIACLHVRSPHILWLSTICNGETVITNKQNYKSFLSYVRGGGVLHVQPTAARRLPSRMECRAAS